MKTDHRYALGLSARLSHIGIPGLMMRGSFGGAAASSAERETVMEAPLVRSRPPVRDVRLHPSLR